MDVKELDKWFSNITVKQKEHIAAKVLLKGGKDVHDAVYPNCTRIWNELDAERKQSIHDHCTDKHGMWAIEENKWNTLGHDF